MSNTAKIRCRTAAALNPPSSRANTAAQPASLKSNGSPVNASPRKLAIITACRMR